MAEKLPGKRKTYSLSLDQEVMKEIKHLAVDEDRNVNALLEESMKDLLKKYRKKVKG